MRSSHVVLSELCGLALAAMTLLPACDGGETAATSGANPDLTAPRVIAATPAEGASAVAADLHEIRITFSEAMDVTVGEANLEGATLGPAVWDGATVSFAV